MIHVSKLVPYCSFNCFSGSNDISEDTIGGLGYSFPGIKLEQKSDFTARQETCSGSASKKVGQMEPGTGIYL